MLAADLGQSSDPTAVAVIEHVRTYRRNTMSGKRDNIKDRFDVRHLARLPLDCPTPKLCKR